MADKIDVFDETGAVREWLAAGRGVNVWRNRDLSSRSVGQATFTPGDGETPPHWNVGREYEHYDTADAFRFWRKARVARPERRTESGAYEARKSRQFRFADSPRGLDAARELAAWLTDGVTSWDAPIGRVRVAYTVQAMDYVSCETRTFGTDTEPSPIDRMYTYVVMEWMSIDESEAEA